MAGKLLIVNGHHHEFKCIPIGSFGLCDYLGRRGGEARILNLALYPAEGYLARLEAEVRRFSPDLVGLVIHWKELLENALHVAFFLKAKFPRVRIVAGGLTASFLGEDLLGHSDEIDFIVRGDPEAAVERLLGGMPLAEVPNLLYRDSGRVRANALAATDKKTMDEMVFTHVDHLVDHQRYIAYLNGFLGWTLMVGRGCAYDCDYCGGSKKAFRETGDRRGLTLRSREAVVRDLKVLGRYTDFVFLGNEPSKPHMYGVLEAIAADPEVAGKFRCGYNTFKLMDSRLIELLLRAFRTGPEIRTPIEVAPETTIEADRPQVRDPALMYTNAELLDSVVETHVRIPGASTIIYFSRYHQTHTRAKLFEELRNIHTLRCQLYERELSEAVSITYCFLSTDVGSANWDQLPLRLGQAGPNGGARTGATELLLRHIRRYQRGRWPDPELDGLCMYRPDEIDDEFEIRYTRLARLLELLLQAGPYYYLVSRVFDFEDMLPVWQAVVEETRHLYLGPSVELHALERVHAGLMARFPERYREVPAFFDGLLMVARRLLENRHSRNVDLPPVEGEQLLLLVRPRLHPERIPTGGVSVPVVDAL